MSSKRKNKRSRKLIGNRTHGRGRFKKARGQGNKGGKGHSGLKHMKTRYYKYEGKRPNIGFVNPNKTKANKKMDTINLYDLDNKYFKGEIPKDKKFTFKGKVLGTGNINYSLTIEAKAFTAKAKEKIEKAGGKFIILTDDTKGTQTN